MVHQMKKFTALAFRPTFALVKLCILVMYHPQTVQGRRGDAGLVLFQLAKMMFAFKRGLLE
jgi:hypothetical protein